MKKNKNSRKNNDYKNKNDFKEPIIIDEVNSIFEARKYCGNSPCKGKYQ